MGTVCVILTKPFLLIHPLQLFPAPGRTIQDVLRSISCSYTLIFNFLMSQATLVDDLSKAHLSLSVSAEFTRSDSVGSASKSNQLLAL